MNRPQSSEKTSANPADAKEAQETGLARLSAILDQHPLPPEFKDMTEEGAMDVAIQAIDEVRRERFERLLALKGAGARLNAPRTQEDIDAQIREFRGDE